MGDNLQIEPEFDTSRFTRALRAWVTSFDWSAGRAMRDVIWYVSVAIGLVFTVLAAGFAKVFVDWMIYGK